MTCATAWWRRKVNCPRVDSRAPRVWTDAPAARAECSASETLYVPPPMELAGPDDDVPPPGGGALTEGKRG